MDDSLAVSVKDLHKSFKLPHNKNNSIKSSLINSANYKKNKGYEIQQVLNGINFEIKKGEFFGIVGRNGSGKSTLLKCLAGIYPPDSGQIQVDGTLTPFIELGVGFNPELSGRDNVYLNGALLGFSRSEMNELYQEIVEFAELENFMDQKLKNYSSGMQVRLAFSVAIRAKGDVLLLDEVLAVGDSLFQQKCFSYFQNLKREKHTVIFVSHSTDALRQYCTNGILLEQGDLISSGNIDKVLNDYTDILGEKESKELEKKESIKNRGNERHGSGKIIIKSFITKNAADGRNKLLFGDDDSEIVILGNFESKEDVELPVYGIVIRDGVGNRMFSSNNLWLHQNSKSTKKGDKPTVEWKIPNFFNTGTYTVSPAVADSSGSEVLDSIDDIIEFKVRKKTTNSSLTNMRHKMIIK